MVSRVEVGVCDLLLYTNLTVFVQKRSKSCHFWPKMTQNERLSDISPDYVLPFPNFWFECPFVRLSATCFLGIPSLLFSENLQLVRACQGGKNFPRAFLKKIPFCPFWPKTVQNWQFGWMCTTVSLRAGNP